MKAGRTTATIASAALSLSTGAFAQPGTVAVWNDPADAVIRRTDPGNDGPLPPGVNLPDVMTVRLCGWMPTNAVADPYTGAVVPGSQAHIFKLEVVFNDTVNPPGTLGFNSQPYNPTHFGPSPVFGFLEIDVDNDINTGGQLGGAATLRYLANVGRFGALPHGPTADRAARSANDYDGDFYLGRQFERSGEDFALVFCGCYAVTIVSQDGNNDSIFDPGETWVVRGRFFQRAAGYQQASAVFGGSAPGLYDPMVNLQFRHDATTNRTTVTLVYALDMQGAAILTGQPQQPVDHIIDLGGNHSSVFEALVDAVNGANGLNGGPLSGPVFVLTDGWRNKNPAAYLDPTQWRITALFGTAYSQPQPGALYVWTDVGFDQTTGDFNGDGLANRADRVLLQAQIENGPVPIVNFGPNFSVYDINSDGVIDQQDLALIPLSCPADWNGDGVLNSLDFFQFLTDFFAGHADFDGHDGTTSLDLFSFLQAYFAGCP